MSYSFYYNHVLIRKQYTPYSVLKGALFMYKMLALLNGLLIALMILINGTLAEGIGYYLSLFIIYSLGLLAVLLLLWVKGESLKSIKYLPKYLFLAGLLGVLNILFNNISFIHLGATLCMGLTLYGQLIASLIIDFGGFFGLEKQVFHPKKLIGIAIMSLGVLIMVIY